MRVVATDTSRLVNRRVLVSLGICTVAILVTGWTNGGHIQGSALL
jgi:hypothetical protein